MQETYSPWLEHLNEYEKPFFTALFEILENRNFTLENPDALPGGYRLSFINGCRYVICDRFVHLPVRGEEPGVYLLDETNGFEMVFNFRAPFNAVIPALNCITPYE